KAEQPLISFLSSFKEESTVTNTVGNVGFEDGEIK
ncbi:hypothetical protein CCACVL1_00688, partial [Corchorus capsularis]